MEGFQHETLSSKVADFVRDRIIFSSYYESGEHISESAIAKELDISRAPVREAFRELKSQGLITSIPRKGNFVVKLTEEDMKEIFEIRILLEGRIFKNLIDEDKLSEDDFKKLTEFVDEMVEAANKPEEENIIVFSKLDIKFHKYLQNKSDLKWTVKILSNLHYQLLMAMVNDLKIEGDLKQAAKNHYQIVDGLKNKNLANSKQVLAEHIEVYNGSGF